MNPEATPAPARFGRVRASRQPETLIATASSTSTAKTMDSASAGIIAIDGAGHQRTEHLTDDRDVHVGIDVTRPAAPARAGR